MRITSENDAIAAAASAEDGDVVRNEIDRIDRTDSKEDLDVKDTSIVKVLTARS